MQVCIRFFVTYLCNKKNKNFCIFWFTKRQFHYLYYESKQARACGAREKKERPSHPFLLVHRKEEKRKKRPQSKSKIIKRKGENKYEQQKYFNGTKNRRFNQLIWRYFEAGRLHSRRGKQRICERRICRFVGSPRKGRFRGQYFI